GPIFDMDVALAKQDLGEYNAQDETKAHGGTIGRKSPAARARVRVRRSRTMDLLEQRFAAPLPLEGIITGLGSGVLPLLVELPLPLVVTGGEQDGRILFANHAAGGFLEVPRQELLRRQAAEFYADPADRPRLLERLRRNGAALDTELRYRTAGGRVVWASV